MSRFADNSDEFARLVLLPAIGDGLAAAALEVQEATFGLMPGRGASATVGRRGRLVYKPSHPRQPPGVRTGLLRNSLTTARIDSLTYGAGTNVGYARYLELGTSRMTRRPFLRPGLRRAARTLQGTFSAAAARSAARRAIAGGA